MFPLIDRVQQGYKFMQPTFYGVKHKGTDYKAHYDSFYIPFPGMVSTFNDLGGGNWIRLVRTNGDVLEFAHLFNRLDWTATPVYSRGGNNAGITGNSGAYTTNPHFHVQITSKGKLVDPEQYAWTPPLPMFPLQLSLTILINNANWDKSLLPKMAQLQDWYWQASNHRLQLIIDYKYTNLTGWQTAFYGENPRVEAITESWYQANLTPLAPKADIIMFVVAKKDWHGVVFDDPNKIELGYCHNLKYPIKGMVFCDEDDMSYYNPTLNGFFDIARHEIGHGLYGLGHLYGTDNTHKWFFANQFEQIFTDLDLNLLGLNTYKIS